MPGQSSNVGLAFGTLASELGQGYAAKKQREHDDARKNIDMITNLVSSGLESGRIENPDEAFEWMMGQFGGGKGKGKKGELPPQLKTILNATKRAVGMGGGAEGPGQQQPQAQAAAPGAAGAQASQGGGAGLPPVPGPPRFRSHATDVQEGRQADIDRAWKDEGSFKDKDGKWYRVQTNSITSEQRKQELPGEPESVVKRPGDTFAGVVTGDKLANKFTEDEAGNPIDPKGHYRYTKGMTGVYPVEAPASEGPSKDQRARVAEYKAAHPGASDEQATQAVELEARQDRVLKSDEERAKLANLWASLTGKQLSNDQKRRAEKGELTKKDTVQIARALLQSGGDKFGLEDVQKTADELFRRFGKADTPAKPGEKLPPVPGATSPPRAEAKKPAAGAAPSPASPGGTGPSAAGATPAAGTSQPFGKGRKLTAQAQRTVDTARDALALIPIITKTLTDAGVQDEDSVGSMASTRLANYLYAIGKSPKEWQDQVIQFGGAVRAFVLTGLMAGRGNKPLQEILDQHIPNPEKDTPLHLMRKLKGLEQIARIAGKTAAEGGVYRPEELVEMFKALPDPKTGAPSNPWRK